MKLLYVSEHRFICDDRGNIYTTGTMTRDYFSRFSGIFDEVVVVGTAEKLCDQNKGKVVAQVLSVANDSLRIAWILDKVAFSRTSQITRTLIARRKAQQYINSCDVVTMKAPSRSSIYVQRIAEQNGKPFLIEVVGCPWDAYWNHGIRGKLVAPLMTCLTKFAVKNAPYAIYVTKDFLQRRYPCAGPSIGVSDVMLEATDGSILEERIARIKTNRPKVVLGTTAAVNVPYKGQLNVFRTLAKLKQLGYEDYEYQMVGGGNQDYLRKQARLFHVEKQVAFLGALPHSRVFEWLDSIDVYVQPSRQEGLPRALIEAMSRGLPCIGTDVGGIPELLAAEYTVSRNRIPGQVAQILISLRDQRQMILAAEQNYIKASEYQKDVLDEKRNSFLLKITRNVQSIC